MCVLTSSVFCVDLGRSWGGGQGEGARACGLTACSLSWAVSATGRFAFPLREPPLANLNKERIYWHDVEKFTEPKTAEIQASKRAQSEWLLDLAANPPSPAPFPRPASQDALPGLTRPSVSPSSIALQETGSPGRGREGGLGQGWAGAMAHRAAPGDSGRALAAAQSRSAHCQQEGEGR